MSMNVSLTPALEDFVNQKVSSGRYGSASEVVREALRLLEDRDRLRDAQIGDLKKEVEKGLRQLDTGDGQVLDVAAIKQKARRQLPKKRSR
jgi:antitoxin ParD1/3/4